MKALVQTTGQFELHDVDAKQTVAYDRPCVVDVTAFISQRSALGQIRTLRGDLPASATDTEFEKFFNESEGDTELAVQSFLSSLPEDAPETPAQSGYSGKPIEGSEESAPVKAAEDTTKTADAGSKKTAETKKD